ncbi:MAG: hypothetical protein ACTHMA_13345 [Thermomicrobiales bacterium]
MPGSFLRRFTHEPLSRVTIALYELPMQYPSVRWQQLLPAAGPDEASQRTRDEWLARTAILLLEDQAPLLTRELQGRVIGRLDEFVDYRMKWDKFAQQPPLREEGGLLLAELDATVAAGKPPRLHVHLRQVASARSTYSILATLIDGFAADTIRGLPSALQSWACVWLTYLIQWYNAAGPAGLRGKITRHPRFFAADGLPDERDFPHEV